MTDSHILKAREFIYSDIQREINLAYATEEHHKKQLLKDLIGHTGGGNFLAALGLLAYTEFAGKLKYDCRNDRDKSAASQNFNRFFDDLGEEYRKFRESHDVYGIFRCGLAHEYFVKESCIIAIIKGPESRGVGQGKNGQYYFVVERYFEDFKRAFDEFTNG